jgi:hypothetical protein
LLGRSTKITPTWRELPNKKLQLTITLSNASKQWSGTHQQLADKRKKLEREAERIVQRHREQDGLR